MIAVTGSTDKRIQEKDILVSINDHEIDDWLDFSFFNDINIKRKIRITTNDHSKTIILKEQEAFNIELADPPWRRCENNCEYCFIKGLPPGSRKTLYFRDDDFRLSFLHGNFISMTNFTNDDYQKIFKLRLSPLYVSVHSTNPHLRSQIFKNDRAADIIKQLEHLIENNIVVHSQVVVFPGINDGAELLRTVKDLISLSPGIASIGIVPVGRTGNNQFLKPVDKKLARKIADLSRELNRQCRKKFKKGIVYAADEIILSADQNIPDMSYYDDMPQHENGIGMVRNFLNAIRSWRFSRRINKRILILSGRLAYPFLLRMKEKMINEGFLRPADLKVRLVENSFFGPSVTVAGLLGGKDFRNAIKKDKQYYDLILLPPYCINSRNKLIDDQELPAGAIVASAEYKGFIKWLQSL